MKRYYQIYLQAAIFAPEAPESALTLSYNPDRETLTIDCASPTGRFTAISNDFADFFRQENNNYPPEKAFGERNTRLIDRTFHDYLRQRNPQEVKYHRNKEQKKPQTKSA